jgi:hypothetical protein
MIDLDLFLSEIADAKPWADEPGISGLVMSALETAEVVVAELRAARQVVEATRGWLRDGEAAGSTDVIRAVTTAVIAYDKATGEANA